MGDLSKVITAIIGLIKVLAGLNKSLEKAEIWKIIRNLVTIFILVYLGRSLFQSSSIFLHTKKNSVLVNEAKRVIKTCGASTYISINTINDPFLSIKDRTIMISDVIKCTNADDCGSSGKDDNEIYGKEYPIGLDDLKYLRQIGGAIQGFKVDGVSIINDDESNGVVPQLLRGIVVSLKDPLSRISFIVVRDILTNMIYIITIGIAKEPNNICQPTTTDMILNTLATTAKNNL